MHAIVIKLLPVFLFFCLGILLRRLRFANAEQAGFLLKFVFFIAVPALVLMKISQLTFTQEKLLLPVVSITINLVCLFATVIAVRLFSIDRHSFGTMLICTAMANNSFIYPFVLYGMGDRAFSDLVLLDVGNALSTAILGYGIALSFNNRAGGIKPVIIKLIMSPLIWAVILALYFSAFSVAIPSAIGVFLDALGQMVGPLIMIALGIVFVPGLEDGRLVALTIFIRSGVGLLAGMLFGWLFGFQGVTFAVILLSAAAPIGFTTLALTAIGQLNTGLASRAVSFSILLGLVYTPVMIFLLYP